MDVVIPAAGKGKRLSELTEYIPKPLLKLNALDTILDSTLKNVIVASRRFWADLHDVFVGIRDKDEEAFWWSIMNSHKSKLIATKIWNERLQFPSTWKHNAWNDTIELLKQGNSESSKIVISSDSIMTTEDFIGFIRSSLKSPTIPGIAIKLSDDENYLTQSGNAYINPAGMISSVTEKPTKGFTTGIVACSLYYLPPLATRYLIEYEGSSDKKHYSQNTKLENMGDLVSCLTKNGFHMKPYRIKYYWHDVSDMTSYLEAMRIYNG